MSLVIMNSRHDNDFSISLHYVIARRVFLPTPVLMVRLSLTMSKGSNLVVCGRLCRHGDASGKGKSALAMTLFYYRHKAQLSHDLLRLGGEDPIKIFLDNTRWLAIGVHVKVAGDGIGFIVHG